MTRPGQPVPTGGYFCTGGTYSLGGAAPSPKKYCSICLTMASWSSRRAGFRRYSLSNILQNSVQPCHACLETFSYIFFPNSVSKGGSSSPGSSLCSLTQSTVRSAIFLLKAYLKNYLILEENNGLRWQAQ